jgi:hypothetical protein
VQPLALGEPWLHAWRLGFAVGELLGLPALATFGPAPVGQAQGAPLWATQAGLCGAGLIAWGGHARDRDALDLTRIREDATLCASLREAVALAGGRPATAWWRSGGGARRRVAQSAVAELPPALGRELARIVRREGNRLGVADLALREEVPR